MRKTGVQILAVPTNHFTTWSQWRTAAHAGTCSLLKRCGPLASSSLLFPPWPGAHVSGRPFLPVPSGAPSTYQAPSLAPPRALLGPAWLCGSSWPAAQQTSVPWGFRTGISPLPGEKDDMYVWNRRGSPDPGPQAAAPKGRPLTVISPFFLASFINFFLFFFPLKAKSNSCRALATRMRREHDFRYCFIKCFFFLTHSNCTYFKVIHLRS